MKPVYFLWECALSVMAFGGLCVMALVVAFMTSAILAREFPRTLIVFVAMFIAAPFVSHAFHVAAQNSELGYEVMMACDFVDFVHNGGGPIGYQNRFKWEYAKWHQSPERTSFEKFMFWDKGILYDATNPPAEYQYPPQFE